MPQPSEPQTIVLVHGLWMNGMELWALRRRLAAAGYRLRSYRHPTIFGEFSSSVARLAETLAAETSPQLHLVAHSLGGVLVRHLVAAYPDLCRGRIVTLGTPHTGSAVARALASHRGLARLTMGSSREVLAQTPPPLPHGCELGSIAGDHAIGVGLLLPGRAAICDGTVGWDETQCPGQADHLTLHSSHFGMLWQQESARQVAHFLAHGVFDHPPVGYWRPESAPE